MEPLDTSTTSAPDNSPAPQDHQSPRVQKPLISVNPPIFIAEEPKADLTPAQQEALRAKDLHKIFKLIRQADIGKLKRHLLKTPHLDITECFDSETGCTPLIYAASKNQYQACLALISYLL